METSILFDWTMSSLYLMAEIVFEDIFVCYLAEIIVCYFAEIIVCYLAEMDQMWADTF